MAKPIFQNEAERRTSVLAFAADLHPDSPTLARLHVAWSDAEAAAHRPGLRPAERYRAEQQARCAMEEYLRVKHLPIVFPFVVYLLGPNDQA